MVLPTRLSYAILNQISAHEPNHRHNCDDSPFGSTHHIHGHVVSIFEQKIKTRKHYHDVKIPIVHFKNKESDTEYLEPQHHTTTVKGARKDFRT